MTSWFTELDFRPDAHPVAMRTRSLGDRPWLIHDEHAEMERELKRQLLAERSAELLIEPPDACVAIADLADLVGAPGPTLTATALAVQEDLALLRRRESGWFLEGGAVCFPTQWSLADKVGKHLRDVHGPVRGYEERIADTMDRMFDRLTERPVWRRNWFLMHDATLCQTTRSDEPVVDIDRYLIRSERQTLRRLPSGWILFTIRIQQAPLNMLLASPSGADFMRWVAEAPSEFARRRHLTPDRQAQLLDV